MNSYQTITQVIANIGKTQSTGVEVTLNTKNIVTKDFFWSTDLTFTKYKDRWKERTPDWKPAVYEQYDAPIRAIYSRYRDWETDRKSTRLNSSHITRSRMPSSA